MREIKFRGKCIEHKKCKKFVFGYLIISGENNSILGEWEKGKGHLKHLVDKKTVGQYIGRKDKNGKEIYEGDVFEAEEPRFESDINKYQVEFQDGSFIGTDIINKVEIYTLKEWTDKEATLEIIGNVWENPELLTNY